MGTNLARILAIAFLALCAYAISFFAGCEKTVPPIGSNTDKRIALTYDDAPRGDGQVYSGSERAEAFLKQLRESNVDQVTMFITTQGMSIGDGQARVEDYANAGHLIANHSDTHPWASRIPTDQYIADIDTAEEKLKGLPNRRPWFRHPYLDEGSYGDANKDEVKRDALRMALKERGLMNGYVTVDTYDWHLEHLWQTALKDGRTVDEDALGRVYVDMVVDAANHYDRMSQKVLDRPTAQVLLLHENDLAARFTTEMVTALRADGWMIISADEAYLDETLNVQTEYAGGGRLSAIAWDKGWRGKAVFSHWSASENGIDARVAREKVFSDNP